MQLINISTNTSTIFINGIKQQKKSWTKKKAFNEKQQKKKQQLQTFHQLRKNCEKHKFFTSIFVQIIKIQYSNFILSLKLLLKIIELRIEKCLNLEQQKWKKKKRKIFFFLRKFDKTKSKKKKNLITFFPKGKFGENKNKEHKRK